MDLLDIANMVCRDLPEGYVANLGMEKGAAWVELLDVPDHVSIPLPDSTDKTLEEQLKDAVAVAVGLEAG